MPANASNASNAPSAPSAAEKLVRLEGLVNEWVVSADPYPVDLDDLWALLGYSTKGNAVRQLFKLKEGEDYKQERQTLEKGGFVLKYCLTLRAATQWCLTAPNKDIGQATYNTLFEAVSKAHAQSPAASPQAPDESTLVIPWKVQYETRMRELDIEEKKVNMSYLELLLRVGVDDRDRILIKDLVWNNIKMPEADDKPRAITESPAPARRALPISDFLKEKGVRWERLTPKERNMYSVAMVKEYQRAHGHAPPKREQWVDGASRMVNHYTDDDRPQFERAYELVCPTPLLL
eukprot:m51a1_g10611 hypothetical protein (291) ;mRNA; f:47243-48359